MHLPRLLHTATFRLAALYLLLFALSVAILLALLYYSMRATLENEVRTRILNEVNLLLFEYREDGLEELLEETEERIEKNRPGERLIYMVQGPSGQVIFDDVPPVAEPYGWRRGHAGNGGIMHFTALDGGYVLGVGQDLGGLESAQSAFLRTFSWSVGAVLVFGLAGGLVLSRRTLAQVDAITRAAHAIGEGRLSQRIEARGTDDEFDSLGQTLNRMLDRIETLVANVRRVSSGIAHDLRTPLARLRARLEDLQATAPSETARSELDAAIADLDNILETFAALLRLAELESGSLRAGLRRTDLSTVAGQVVDAYLPIAEESGIRVETRIRHGIEVNGDAHLLQQLIANLVENVIRHGGPGVTLQVGLALQLGRPTLEVADDGRGIPAAERERMLQPFERLDEERAGNGLGLALVAAIAQLHEATLELADNQPGLLCRVTFPA